MRSTSGALRLFALSVAALWASEAALQGVAAADEDPIGTREHNITADAVRILSLRLADSRVIASADMVALQPSVNYRGPGWRSDVRACLEPSRHGRAENFCAVQTSEGFYQAYSNSSDASVTFSFTGVGSVYVLGTTA